MFGLDLFFCVRVKKVKVMCWLVGWLFVVALKESVLHKPAAGLGCVFVCDARTRTNDCVH